MDPFQAMVFSFLAFSSQKNLAIFILPAISFSHVLCRDFFRVHSLFVFLVFFLWRSSFALPLTTVDHSLALLLANAGKRAAGQVDDMEPRPPHLLVSVQYAI